MSSLGHSVSERKRDQTGAHLAKPGGTMPVIVITPERCLSMILRGFELGASDFNHRAVGIQDISTTSLEKDP